MLPVRLLHIYSISASTVLAALAALCHLGPVWSLSHVARVWETPDRLARLATVPVNGVLEAKRDFSGLALELRILRMLAFFGLLDVEREPTAADGFLSSRRYRKTPLFDRFVSFDQCRTKY